LVGPDLSDLALQDRSLCSEVVKTAGERAVEGLRSGLDLRGRPTEWSFSALTT
jgi:hypothetical protein